MHTDHSPTPDLAATAPAVGWVQRAQPWLGTLVRIGVHGLDDAAAHAAIERGFAAVGAIHGLMSFHEPGSELSRLNREAPYAAVRVDRRTREVLQLALAVAEASDGVFDPTIAPWLVGWDYLPAPRDAPRPEPRASWRDVELEGEAVRFRCPLWLDFGGIAKGYAVDAALEAMALPTQVQACVDAGGDLRVSGPWPQHVVLNAPAQSPEALPLLELTDGAVASSSGLRSRRRRATRWVGPHLHGRRRRPAPVERFASVVAPCCAVADALTKVALAAGPDAAGTYARFDATAHLFSRGIGWQTIGRTA
jgi:thiamine biosynthesis lipoprotein